MGKERSVVSVCASKWKEGIETNIYKKRTPNYSAMCTFQVLFKEENTITTTDSGNVDVGAVFEVSHFIVPVFVVHFVFV